MKTYLSTDPHLDHVDNKYESISKTKTLCNLMLDIATHANDCQTFSAALELASGELDRLEMYFDTGELGLHA